MKKILLTTSALVGAGLLLAPAASAQTKFGISGGVDFRMVYAIYGNAYGKDGVPSNATDGKLDDGWNDFKAYVDGAELSFSASNTSDTGLTYGVNYQLNSGSEVDSGNTKADEVSAYISGEWGKVEFGYQDGAEDQLKISGYVDGGTGNIDGGAPGRTATGRANGAGDAPDSMGIAGNSGDAAKISYFSPSFAGVKAGLSYAPTRANEGDLISHNIGIGVTYGGAAGGISYDVALVSGINMPGAEEATHDDYKAAAIGIGFGTKIGVAGATIGLGVDYSISEGNKVDDNKMAATVGVSYNYGQGNVGLGFLYGLDLGTYKTGTSDKTVAPTDGEDRGDTFWKVSVGADYTVVSGVSVRLDLAYSVDTIDVRHAADGTVIAANDDDDGTALGVVVGTKVSF